MTNTSSAPTSSTPQESTFRFHFLHVGANAISIMMGLGLASWIWLIFWRSTTVPSAISLAWVITAYLIFEPVTAALTVFRKDRWFAAVFDLLTAVALFIEMVLVIYDQQSLGVMGARLESAYLLLFATFGGLIVDLLVTLIVNTRIFASSSN